jgi:hypothetical protein
MTLQNIHALTEMNTPFNRGQPVPMVTKQVFGKKGNSDSGQKRWLSRLRINILENSRASAARAAAGARISPRVTTMGPAWSDIPSRQTFNNAPG